MQQQTLAPAGEETLAEENAALAAINIVRSWLSKHFDNSISKLEPSGKLRIVNSVHELPVVTANNTKATFNMALLDWCQIILSNCKKLVYYCMEWASMGVLHLLPHSINSLEITKLSFNHKVIINYYTGNVLINH